MVSRGMSLQISSSNVTTPSVHFASKDTDDKDFGDHPDDPAHSQVHYGHHISICSHPREALYRTGESGEPPERDPEDMKSLKPIPTTVVPLYHQRLVMVKLADNFVRIGTGSMPILSKLNPPLKPPVNDDVLDSLRDLGKKKKKKKTQKAGRPPFMYQDFTFLADESASITESWYRQARAFFHIRLGVKRGQDEDLEYLCAVRTPNDQYEVLFDKNTFGSWWRITALSINRYVAESLQYPGRCLTKGRFGLSLGPPLTERERAGIVRGKIDESRSVTIYTLPDFAVWHPGVCVN